MAGVEADADFTKVANTKAKAGIWKHFSLKKMKTDGRLVLNVALCNKCNAEVRYSGGTTNLNTHMRRHHSLTFSNSHSQSNESINTMQSTESSSQQVSIVKKSTISGYFGNSTKYSSKSTRALLITGKIANFIVKDLRPFRIVESKEFREILSSLDPRYQVPGRKQFSEIIIPKMYEDMKILVQKDLSSAETVALTTDGWSSRATESYMTITSVHINVDWELVNYVLQTRALPESHTGEHVAEVLNEAVTEWNLPAIDGAPPLVTDNASNMLKAGKLFETKLHVTCYAHTLNLACQKCLKVKRVSNLLARIRQLVSYFHRSNMAAAVLKTKAHLLSVPAHKLIIDVCTRWNSSYDMLQRFLEMQVAVFATLRSKELKVKDYKSFSDEDLTLAEEVTQLLKPLKDVTVALCSEKIPTVSLIMPLQHQLMNRVLVLSDDDSPTIQEMKKSLIEDLKNRYLEQKPMLYICSAMDPRFKMLPFLSEEIRFDVFNQVAAKAATIHNTSPVEELKIKKEIDPALPELPTLPEDLTEDDEHAEMNAEIADTVCPSPLKKIKQEPESCGSSSNFLGDIFGEVYICGQDPPQKLSPHVLAQNECKVYNELPPIALTECPLAWWKQNEYRLPVLARLAKQVLCIPATSVPSERVFSTAGDILTAQRATLKSKHLDVLLFLKKNSK